MGTQHLAQASHAVSLRGPLEANNVTTEGVQG
jgi:hypothetical protein